MKKILNILIVLFISLSLYGCASKLPLPELESGMRGELGIDANINEKTIDKYLNRKDAVYRDMRMLKDEADYENIGGDSYLSGVVEGFEVVSFPYLCNVEGLPEAVGETYTGVTLFSYEDGEYIPNYEESVSMLEKLFPKDKTIFLMCGGGGYAGMTKELLVGLGWDGNKIYNTGGYWYYEGNHRIETKYIENGETKYDFSKIIYHDIDFEKLSKLRDSGSEKRDPNAVTSENHFIRVENNEQLKELIKTKEDLIVHVYNPGCPSCAKFLPVIEKFEEENDYEIYSVILGDIWYEDNPIKEKVQYTPSVFIFKNGEVIAYLDPSSNEDLDYYKSSEKFSLWMSQFMEVNEVKENINSGIEECESGCTID